ncbi:MAG TPA: DUF5668 domain-containing protein [Thermoanaerobaculia bacterium]
MTGSNALRITPKLIFGFGVLALGILWTLDNLDVIESERITEWWPVILILVGIVKLLDDGGGRLAGAILATIGSVILLGNLNLIHWKVFDLIPLVIAIIGGKLVWDALVRRRDRPLTSDDDPSATVSVFAMMAGIKRKSVSHAFKGGDANAIMGGVELDLRDAQIADGEEAVIEAFAFWGGIEITVPHHWRVVGKVMPVMGGFEDNTVSGGGNGPVLVIRGAAIMGAVEVKNFVHASADR